MDRLQARIFALVAGSLAVSAAALTWWAVASFERSVNAEFRLRGMVLTRTFLHESTLAFEHGDGSAAQPFLDSLLADPDVVEAYLLDSSGVARAAKRREGAPPGPFRPDARLAGAAAERFTPQFGESTEDGRRFLTVYQRVWAETARGVSDRGLCVLRLGAYRVEREAARMARSLSAVAALFTLLAALAAYRFTLRLTGPLERLRAAAEAVRGGGLPAALPTDAGGEIGDLARGFSAMAAEVRASQETLEARVAQRTAELARSNADLENYAAIASHDLRAPLHQIAGFSDLLARQSAGALGAEGAELLAHIQAAVARMDRIIADILDYSHLSAAARTLSSVDMSAVFDQAAAVLGAGGLEPGTALTRERLPVVRGDEQQLLRLFENLLGNALKYRGVEVPRIHATAERDGKMWLLRVSDNGIGIPAADRGRVFELFTRLQSGAGRKGTGIGLAVCRRIVELHGGRIWAEDNGAGPGARLCFTLPVEQA